MGRKHAVCTHEFEISTASATPVAEAGLRAEVLKVVEPEASGAKSGGGGRKRKKR